MAAVARLKKVRRLSFAMQAADARLFPPSMPRYGVMTREVRHRAGPQSDDMAYAIEHHAAACSTLSGTGFIYGGVPSGVACFDVMVDTVIAAAASTVVIQ